MGFEYFDIDISSIYNLHLEYVSGLYFLAAVTKLSISLSSFFTKLLALFRSNNLINSVKFDLLF